MGCTITTLQLVKRPLILSAGKNKLSVLCIIRVVQCYKIFFLAGVRTIASDICIEGLCSTGNWYDIFNIFEAGVGRIDITYLSYIPDSIMASEG
uniref:Uncharacterized protein n=1 Tax=Kalanchoe fedtschenkoi TaxID=63787 RepID=A0A7N1A0U0_KALFE